MFWTVFSNLCANANISPNAVATELKIPSGSITAWHNGAIPRTKSLTKIANYFDVTPDYLLHGDEQTKKAHRTRRWAYIRFARKHSKTHFYLLAEPGFYCFAIRSCAADAKSAS